MPHCRGCPPAKELGRARPEADAFPGVDLHGKRLSQRLSAVFVIVAARLMQTKSSGNGKRSCSAHPARPSLRRQSTTRRHRSRSAGSRNVTICTTYTRNSGSWARIGSKLLEATIDRLRGTAKDERQLPRDRPELSRCHWPHRAGRRITVSAFTFNRRVLSISWPIFKSQPANPLTRRRRLEMLSKIKRLSCGATRFDGGKLHRTSSLSGRRKW